MNATSSKIIYALGLLFLAACAVIPEPRQTILTAETVSAPLSTEARLARTISERISLEASESRNDVRLSELRTAEQDLRRAAFEDDAQGARSHLIDALAGQLSLAMVKRTELASGPAPEPKRLAQADAVIRGLTLAINVEVRSLST